ncbi:MAG: anhydro-N-acetylmuramic acid kinase [Robiginitomaculum sp.]|nr:MAG: anhydro-N-acetylmuramic acid kinase [Robiginitomaculum sp.]
MRAIGLMSGTSLDGMDAALLETDGQRITHHGPAQTFPFDTATKALLQSAVDDALHWQFTGAHPDSFAPAAKALAISAQNAVEIIMDKVGLGPNDIDLVGFHGQTVLHTPPSGGALGQTCQIGDAQALANALGITVVHDFRTNDMVNGGHGAPFAPAYHRALAADLPKPVMILNLGGVGNLTWLGAGGQMLAFDTGPGNGPLDAWVQQNGAGEMDRGGAIATKGQVDEARITSFLEADFFALKPPKSIDRWDFDARLVAGMSLEDGAATLSAFCAHAVARAMDWLPHLPKSILVCGGGRHNPVLMGHLAKATGIAIAPVEDQGWRGDALEAEAFAHLGVRHVRGLPLSWPGTTGVDAPMCGGRLVKPGRTGC